MLVLSVLLSAVAVKLGSCQMQINRTIDDSLGDSSNGLIPVYSPKIGAWNFANCTGCAIQGSPPLAFDGTWASATYKPALGSVSIAFPFTGTALYVYFITANTLPDSGITSNTECNFTMDGENVGSYEHISDNSTILNYNVLVYSATSLPNANHQFVVSTSGMDFHVYLMFDYAIYTFENTITSTPIVVPPTSASAIRSTERTTVLGAAGTTVLGAAGTTVLGAVGTTVFGAAGTTVRSAPGTSVGDSTGVTGTVTSTPTAVAGNITATDSTSSSTPTGAIAGGVVGGLVLFGLVAVILTLCRRRDRAQDPIPETEHSALPPQGETYPNVGHVQTQHQFVSAPLRNGHWRGPSSTTESEPNYVNRAPMVAINSSEAEGGSCPLGSVSNDHLVTGSASGTTAQSNAKSELRQAQLQRQMRTIQQDIHDLQHEQRYSTAIAPSSSQWRSEASDMRRQMDMMRAQIDLLQSQQASAWAQGLSDQPPPGYEEHL